MAAATLEQCGAVSEAVVREIEARGGRALAVQADIADAAQVREMAARVTSALGAVDILVNNAAQLLDLGVIGVAEVEEMRYKVAKKEDTSLQQLIDNIVELYLTTLYKLKFLA